jgi:S1-C subfamily serine protease
MMDETLILDATERYINGEMNQQEKIFFEEMRKNNPEMDQFVVEHIFFLNEVQKYGDIKNFKHSLYEIETKLAGEGLIGSTKLTSGARVIYLWKKFKRTAAVAASIAVVVSLLTIGLSTLYKSKTNPQLIDLSRQLEEIKKDQKNTNKELANVKQEIKVSPNATPKSGGTGFLIDGKGYLITNAHVLKGETIVATNYNGEQFIAKICMKDMDRDIAVLKIDDKDYKPLNVLPYSISKTVNLAEPIYTMGYPKDQIVYGEGYLSSESGYKSDTLTYQISIAADHGNSGGPVLNKNGNIIGILTDKLEGGAVFAVKSLYIFKAVENLKKNPEYAAIRLSGSNSIKGLIREQQVKKVNDCVFLIKSY